MKKSLLLVGCTLSLFMLGGCVNTSLTADVDPAVDLSTLDSFYVVKQPADKRDLHQMIASQLTGMGKQATAGTDDTPPAPVDAVVTYIDKWMWDITMYMLELTIDIRAPDTNYKMASGNSYRTSLARKSPEEMIAEVLGEIFQNNQNSGD